MAKKIKLSTIKPNPNNPRLVKDDKFFKLVQSIKDFGEKMMPLRPIVIDEENIILGGNMRFKAIKEIGLKEVPEDWIKKASDLSEEEKQEFIIKDNVGFGEWDWDTLANEWDAEKLEEWGLDIPNFEDFIEAETEEDDYEEPEHLQVDVVEGDLIEFVCDDGRVHKLICGSSLEVDNWELLTNGKEFDCMVTDPPYNVAYVGKTKDALTIQNDSMSDDNFYQFLYDFYSAANSYCKAGGAWYVWFADVEVVNFSKAFIDSGIKLAQILIWLKDSMVMGRKDYHFKHEPCLYGWKEGAAHNWFSDRKQTTIL